MKYLGSISDPKDLVIREVLAGWFDQGADGQPQLTKTVNNIQSDIDRLNSLAGTYYYSGLPAAVYAINNNTPGAGTLTQSIESDEYKVTFTAGKVPVLDLLKSSYLANGDTNITASCIINLNGHSLDFATNSSLYFKAGTDIVINAKNSLMERNDGNGNTALIKTTGNSLVINGGEFIDLNRSDDDNQRDISMVLWANNPTIKIQINDATLKAGGRFNAFGISLGDFGNLEINNSTILASAYEPTTSGFMNSGDQTYGVPIYNTSTSTIGSVIKIVNSTLSGEYQVIKSNAKIYAVNSIFESCDHGVYVSNFANFQNCTFRHKRWADLLVAGLQPHGPGFPQRTQYTATSPDYGNQGICYIGSSTDNVVCIMNDCTEASATGAAKINLKTTGGYKPSVLFLSNHAVVSGIRIDNDAKVYFGNNVTNFTSDKVDTETFAGVNFTNEEVIFANLSKSKTNIVNKSGTFTWKDFTYDYVSDYYHPNDYQETFIGGYMTTYTIHCAGKTLGFSYTCHPDMGADGSYITINGVRQPDTALTPTVVPPTKMTQDIVIYSSMYGIYFSDMVMEEIIDLPQLLERVSDVETELSRKANSDEVVKYEIASFNWTDYTYDYSLSGNDYASVGMVTSNTISGTEVTYTIHCAGETLGFDYTDGVDWGCYGYIKVNGQNLFAQGSVVNGTLPLTYMEQDIEVYCSLVTQFTFSNMKRKSLDDNYLNTLKDKADKQELILKADKEYLYDLGTFSWTDFTYDFSGNSEAPDITSNTISGGGDLYIIHCKGKTLGFDYNAGNYESYCYIKVNGQKLFQEPAVAIGSVPLTYMTEDIEVYCSADLITFTNMQILEPKGITLGLQSQVDNINTTLDDCVKNTDFATGSKGGVVKVYGGYGIEIGTTGTITTSRATEAEIDARTHSYNVITPKNLEYAVKSIGDGYYATEQQVGDIETALDNIIAIQNQLIGGGTV